MARRDRYGSPHITQTVRKTGYLSASRAFTLIEVLVVVAIIALLVSILLPSLSRARAQARSAVCANNAKEIVTAANLFATEYKERIPRGISRNGPLAGRIDWITMVIRRLGDKKSYVDNFNRVPVEDYEVFTCPERSSEYSGRFLDFVVNSMDHRGPMQLERVHSDPAGTWYEVQGTSKISVWKQPSEVIYITDAIEESWAVHDDQNTWDTLKGVRENISKVRSPAPGSLTGLDWFDVPGGKSVPMYREWVGYGAPRAALKMHLNRGSNGGFVDGHVELVKPPPQANGVAAVQQFYYRKFGVDPKVIPLITSTHTAGSFHECTAGDISWRP